MPLNRAAAAYSSRTLHGYWPSALLPPQPAISYDAFLDTSFPGLFLDSTTMLNTTGCGQFREYVKHGARSGLSFEDWLARVSACFALPSPYPHQCRFDGAVNVVVTASTSAGLSLVGCKPAYPFRNPCLPPPYPVLP